jgi:hypothetical protein
MRVKLLNEPKETAAIAENAKFPRRWRDPGGQMDLVKERVNRSRVVFNAKYFAPPNLF